jgi:Ca2+-binding EF-hand superfamily protein
MKPKGDIDGDGHLDVKDIIVVLQIFANIDVQIENDMMYFDVNDNGRVDYGELLSLLRWIAK